MCIPSLPQLLISNVRYGQLPNVSNQALDVTGDVVGRHDERGIHHMGVATRHSATLVREKTTSARQFGES